MCFLCAVYPFLRRWHDLSFFDIYKIHPFKKTNVVISRSLYAGIDKKFKIRLNFNLKTLFKLFFIDSNIQISDHIYQGVIKCLNFWNIEEKVNKKHKKAQKWWIFNFFKNHSRLLYLWKSIKTCPVHVEFLSLPIEEITTGQRVKKTAIFHARLSNQKRIKVNRESS